jgi:alanine dehydrogenase
MSFPINLGSSKAVTTIVDVADVDVNYYDYIFAITITTTNAVVDSLYSTIKDATLMINTITVEHSTISFDNYQYY